MKADAYSHTEAVWETRVEDGREIRVRIIGYRDVTRSGAVIAERMYPKKESTRDHPRRN